MNSFTTLNSPITNVFRIYNETSGEVYNTIRWSNDKVYFTYNTSPSIAENFAERALFKDVLNEILFVNTNFTNTSSITIYKCLLENNNIISSTEDCIASFINTTTKFSDTLIFKTEKWFDKYENESNNVNRLTSVGEYQIDYSNGIVYCAVSNDQFLDIGSISYKSNSIIPQFPHLISVDDIYNRISILAPKDKTFNYSSFGDGFIYPENMDVSDEGFFNGDTLYAYLTYSGQIGTFENTNFVPGVANNIKFLRGIYSFDDIKYNILPLNFAESSTFSGTVIDVAPISRQEYGKVFHNIDGYYVDVNYNLQYLSSDITFNISIIRNSDLDQLWDISGVIVIGEIVRLRLSGINSPNANDSVTIDYSFTINDLTRVIVDYNKGDFFIDYSYLIDEIIISYEYGENLIDFRKSRTISTNDIYYVTYKVGALRDALLKNFGTLVNIPELSSLGFRILVPFLPDIFYCGSLQ